MEKMPISSESEKKETRRSFLRKAVIGAAALAAGSAAGRLLHDVPQKQEKLPDLGSVDVKIPDKKETPPEQKNIVEEQ